VASPNAGRSGGCHVSTLRTRTNGTRAAPVFLFSKDKGPYKLEATWGLRSNGFTASSFSQSGTKASRSPAIGQENRSQQA